MSRCPADVTPQPLPIVGCCLIISAFFVLQLDKLHCFRERFMRDASERPPKSKADVSVGGAWEN
jgi:hypothetical protein